MKAELFIAFWLMVLLLASIVVWAVGKAVQAIRDRRPRREAVNCPPLWDGDQESPWRAA